MLRLIWSTTYDINSATQYFIIINEEADSLKIESSSSLKLAICTLRRVASYRRSVRYQRHQNQIIKFNLLLINWPCCVHHFRRRGWTEKSTKKISLYLFFFTPNPLLFFFAAAALDKNLYFVYGSTNTRKIYSVEPLPFIFFFEILLINLQNLRDFDQFSHLSSFCQVRSALNLNQKPSYLNKTLQTFSIPNISSKPIYIEAKPSILETLVYSRYS